MSANHEERRQRLVHRIEAFSDLVIGFSLALLGLTLVIPAHAVELLTQPVWLISYLWTFAWISLTWFSHQRIFAVYFVPTPIAIVVNFALLASLALGVYFLQVFLHVEHEVDHAIALLMYFTTLAITLLALGTLYALGTWTRWSELDANDRYFGFARAVRLLIVGASILIGVAATPVLFVELHLHSTLTIAYAAVGGVIIARLIVRAFKPRVMGGVRAAA